MVLLVIPTVCFQISWLLNLGGVLNLNLSLSSYFQNFDFDEKLDYHWHHYLSSSSPTRGSDEGDKGKGNNRTRTLLIAQYTGLDERYLEFASISERANRAYAKKWNHDYVLMKGVAINSGQPGDATYNKLALLKEGIDSKIYDAMLMLDADSVIVDFDQDALKLIPQSMLLTAHRVQPTDVSYTDNVNIGVTIWNLRHKKASEVYDKWLRRVIARATKTFRVIPDDQAELHQVLLGYSIEERKSMVNAINTTHFAGSFVRHVIRSDGATWASGEDDLDRRKQSIEKAVQKVCAKWFNSCD